MKLVTTASRGVFAGEIVEDNAPDHVKMTNVRMCTYWSRDMRGVFGLAAQGPSDSCRIGPAVPSKTLYGVTSISEITPEAAAKWESEPWG